MRVRFDVKDKRWTSQKYRSMPPRLPLKLWMYRAASKAGMKLFASLPICIRFEASLISDVRFSMRLQASDPCHNHACQA